MFSISSFFLKNVFFDLLKVSFWDKKQQMKCNIVIFQTSQVSYLSETELLLNIASERANGINSQTMVVCRISPTNGKEKR